MGACFITGVSSGLGEGLAKALLDRGERVFGLSRRVPEWHTRPGFSHISLDLSRLDAIVPAVSRLLSGAGRLDLVILNAGVLGGIGDMADAPLARLRYVMDVNLWANKAVLDAVFAGNREVEQVAAVSSGAAVSGARGWNAYALSKAALNMMMKLYAAERPATHFCSLAPGLVESGMQAEVRTLPADERFATVERLKRAAFTADMPSPAAVAPRMLEALRNLRKQPSGGFHDLRAL